MLCFTAALDIKINLDYLSRSNRTLRKAEMKSLVHMVITWTKNMNHEFCMRYFLNQWAELKQTNMKE